MTLLEKVQELQSIKPPLSQEDFNSKLNAYKASQPKEELKEDKPEVFVCECGRDYKTENGLKTHKSKWCKLNKD